MFVMSPICDPFLRALPWYIVQCMCHLHRKISPKERRKKRKKESTNEFEKEGGVSRAKREEREGSEKGVRRE
jgi:hypothetical protein